jgi:hypothetical protein
MGRKAKDYTGQRFNRLIGLRNTGNKCCREFIWEWQCDCGNIHRALGRRVADGSTKSCGCYRNNRNKLTAGDRFGRLVLIGKAGIGKFGNRLWRWQCDCGSIIDRNFQPIKEGRQVSCGCHAREESRKRAKHGQWRTRTYRAWVAMKARCIGDNCPEHYKLRGISICDQWINSFDAFLSDMGECPEGLTLERIKNDAGYEPRNCRWATQAEQTRNTRRTIRVMVRGQEMCLKDACTEIGANYDRVRSRIRLGRSPQIALDAG